MLAESWDVSSDLTQFKLNLRKGVQFHTGREFTSDDVKYNLLRVRDPKVGGSSVRSQPEQLVHQHRHARQVHRRPEVGPAAPGACSTSSSTSTCVDKDTAEGPDAKTKTVGTGPFTFVEWVQGDHFTFTRNKNYWQSGKPYLDEVSIQVLNDAQAQIAQLEAGALDLADSPPVRDAARLQEDPQYNYLGTFIGGQYFCVFINTSVPPLDNKTVRQALNYALDRQRFASTVMLNLVGSGSGPALAAAGGRRRASQEHVLYVRPGQGEVAAVQRRRRDRSRSTSCTTTWRTPRKFRRSHSCTRPTWTKIGIKANLKLLEFATFADTVLNQPYHGLAIAGGAFAHLAESTTAFTTGRGSNIMLRAELEPLPE